MGVTNAQWKELANDLQGKLKVADERAKAAEGFILRLAAEGGAMVSSGVCSQIEIANARNRGDWFQLGDLGFVLRMLAWRLSAEKAITHVLSLAEDEAMAVHSLVATINELKAGALLDTPATTPPATGREREGR